MNLSTQPTERDIQRAKTAAIAERHTVLKSVKGAREAALYLLDFYPESVPALMEFISLSEDFGYATFTRAVMQAQSEKYGPSSMWDPRR